MNTIENPLANNEAHVNKPNYSFMKIASLERTQCTWHIFDLNQFQILARAFAPHDWKLKTCRVQSFQAVANHLQKSGE